MTPDTVALIPAAGAGLRMGGELRKQYLELDGVPILVRTLNALAASPRIGGMVVAVPAEDVGQVTAMIGAHAVPKVVALVPGGETRQASVAAALAAAPAAYPLVLVHDAVRPFVTLPMIERTLDAAREAGGAVAAMPVKDTLKRVVDGAVAGTVEREGIVRIQTPQAFTRALLDTAVEGARRDRFEGTDESSLAVRVGGTVRVVAGDETNLKVTTPDDLPLAQAILSARRAPAQGPRSQNSVAEAPDAVR